MFLEALVVAACLQQKGGCSESTSAYYKSNKELQEATKNAEALGKRIVNGNEWIVYAATPMYAIATGATANFHIHKGWIFGVDIKNERVMIQWSY